MYLIITLVISMKLSLTIEIIDSQINSQIEALGQGLPAYILPLFLYSQESKGNWIVLVLVHPRTIDIDFL